MQIDFEGRLRNTNLPISKPLLPLLDAIINSIDAIEEIGSPGEGTIHVMIEREKSQQILIGDDRRPIEGFIIEDTGIGFTAENYNSFDTADSRLKRTKGAKGIGRFLWLKAFESVRVVSTFFENDKWHERSFDFGPTYNGIGKNELKETTSIARKTRVALQRFRPEYQESCPTNANIISQKIIDHCLTFFISGIAPKMLVHDSADVIDLNELFRRRIYSKAQSNRFRIKNQDFDITNLKLYSPAETRHLVHFCAHKREVLEENLSGAIADLKQKLKDEEEKSFVISSFVSGKFLDESVNLERTDFDFIVADEDSSLFPNEITRKDLKSGTIEQVKIFLKPYLDSISQDKMQQIQRFVQTKGPQYRPVLKYKPDYLTDIPPGLPDEKLDIELHRLKARIETELKEKGAQILDKKIEDIKDFEVYQKDYEEFIEKLNDFGKSNLAQYILHRKLILDLFSHHLGIAADGKYSREEIIHQIIFPLKSTSDDIDYEQQNLWIIDEKLSYHSYLASDLPFKKIKPIDIEGTERPDLIVFNTPFAFVEESPPFSSVVIIEFKRPAREEYSEDENPIKQVYDYVRKIRQGNVSDKKGRPILIKDSTPFYCYVVCDLTKKIREQAENHAFISTPDGMGYFHYNTNLMAYTEVISYDKLLSDSTKRNRILFDKLCLPQH
jgi:hypothetical protein